MNFNASFEKRFWSKVQKTESCWNWTASTKTGTGYGQISWNSDGDMIKAHRASYILHFGSFPEKLLVCHKCDNQRCVNPQHLFLGTSKDNHRDRNSKNRQAKGSQVGTSKLQEDEVRAIKNLRNLGVSVYSLSAFYKVSRNCIYSIINKKQWKHIS